MLRVEQKIMKYGCDFRFPTDKFKGMIMKDIRMAVLVNPNNPAGSIV